MKIDFHIHTKYSPDSLIQPDALAKKAMMLGIIPALTDHYSVSCHASMRALGAQFIPGEEILTDKGDLVGLYISELIPKNTPFAEALDLVRAQGGITYLPHMYDYGRAGRHASDEEASRVDIIEVFNARVMDDSINEKAKKFAEKHNKLKAAGSDSHFLFEFGSTYAELPDFDIESPKALLKALKSAKLVTKKAPFFVRGPTSILKLGKDMAHGVGWEE